MAGRGLGIAQEMVEAILDADRSPLFTEPEKAAIALAVEATYNVSASPETFARAARHFDERQLVELALVIGLANMNNRFTDVLDADVEEEA